jgi:hypothetical protein
MSVFLKMFMKCPTLMKAYSVLNATVTTDNTIIITDSTVPIRTRGNVCHMPYLEHPQHMLLHTAQRFFLDEIGMLSILKSTKFFSFLINRSPFFPLFELHLRTDDCMTIAVHQTETYAGLCADEKTQVTIAGDDRSRIVVGLERAFVVG